MRKINFKKNWPIYLLIAIMLATFFIRVFHFQDWLLFGLDQSRDANLIKQVKEKGFNNLPLLGPRAAGSYLRLGPVFYYFQFISVMLFDSSEAYVLAYPDLFFSILTIPLFYFFLKKYFTQYISILLVAVYSFSLIAIQYSRFAWNPNSVPFWTVLFLLALYNVVSLKDKKKAGCWLLLVALAYGIVSQLHFVSLLIFDLVGIIYLIIYRPRIKLIYWVGSLLILFVLYIPMILSEIQTDGDNLNQFHYAIFAKSEIDPGYTLSQYYLMKVERLANEFTLFLTSWQSRVSKLSSYFGLIFIFAGGILLISQFFGFKKRKIKFKKNLLKDNRGKFLILTLICLFISFPLFIKADSSLKPRFIFPVFFMPYLFLGLFYNFLEKFFKDKNKIIVFIFSLCLIIINLQAVFMWYSFLKNQDYAFINRGTFIKQSDGITYGNIKRAVYDSADKAKENNQLLCFYASATYRRSVEYVLSLKYEESFYDRISHSMKNSKKEKCYLVAINETNENKIIEKRYENDFNLETQYKFGLISVWGLNPKPIFFDYEKLKELRKQEESLEKKEEKINDEEEDNEEDKEDELEKPRRKERVYWGEVF